MTNSNLKQFKDGVAIGRAYGVPLPMWLGYYYGYWLSIMESQLKDWSEMVRD